MSNLIMDESKVFDACALVEQIELLSVIEPFSVQELSLIRQKAAQASQLLNQALEGSQKVGVM